MTATTNQTAAPIYYICSGEGELGTWTPHTGRQTLTALRRAANRESCAGARWVLVARATGRDDHGNLTGAVIDLTSGDAVNSTIIGAA